MTRLFGVCSATLNVAQNVGTNILATALLQS